MKTFPFQNSILVTIVLLYNFICTLTKQSILNFNMAASIARLDAYVAKVSWEILDQKILSDIVTTDYSSIQEKNYEIHTCVILFIYNFNFVFYALYAFLLDCDVSFVFIFLDNTVC